MIVTEEQARRKWCPQAMSYASHLGGHAAVNRRHDTGEPWQDCNCIASDCMMWRWAEQGHDAGDMPGTGVHPSTGYCGLAGKPDGAS